MSTSPATLQEAIIHFSNVDNCIAYLVERRWANGVICPTCGSKDVAYLPSRRLWQCKTRHPKAQFSVKVGTIMEDSAITLDKWLTAIWMVTSCKNGIGSYEISRSLKITQKCSWHMLHRIRLALQDSNTGGMLGGEIEVDETFIGGKSRKIHADKRARKITGTGPEGKAIVAAVLERGGKVRVRVMENRKKATLQKLIRDNVGAGSSIDSDALKSYDGLEKDYIHETVDHAVQYVRENVHTQRA